MEDRHNGWLALHSPNIVNLCMDSYGGKEQQGRLYHLYTAEAVPFSSLLEAMDRMDRLYDMLDLPQACTRLRSFQENRGERKKDRAEGKETIALPERGKKDIKRVETFDKVTEHRGKDATFLIRVKYRQNSSWQGEVTWVDGQKREYFRSALELIRLIDSALEVPEG